MRQGKKKNNNPYFEQLNFWNQPNERIYIVEKVNPLFYNPQIEKNEMKYEVKRMMKNKKNKKEKVKWRPVQNFNKKKKKKISNWCLK